MISRSRRKRDGWFGFFRTKKPRIQSPDILDEAAFFLAIEKERSRAERRDLTFCILKLELDQQLDAEIGNMLGFFRQRLRITDEIGWFEGQYAVLLPETIPSQAARVAVELGEIAEARCGIEVQSDILVFPDTIDSGTRPPNQKPGSSSELKYDSDSGVYHAERGDEPGGSASASSALVASPTKTRVRKRQTISVRRLNTARPVPVWKRLVDVGGAGTGLVLLSPVFLIAALMIKLTSRGPVFFTQWREGKDGRLFKIYKFRTMRVGADDEKGEFRAQSEQDGPAFKLKNDPRLTRLGKYLRKSCVDELPQLLNVLKGEMSLVGPRPLPVDESLNCSLWHRRRLDVLPGMTCIWQIDGGRDTPFNEWMRMDLEYVRKSSLFTDLWLILRTAVLTVFHRGSV